MVLDCIITGRENSTDAPLIWFSPLLAPRL